MQIKRVGLERVAGRRLLPTVPQALSRTTISNTLDGSTENSSNARHCCEYRVAAGSSWEKTREVSKRVLVFEGNALWYRIDGAEKLVLRANQVHGRACVCVALCGQ